MRHWYRDQDSAEELRKMGEDLKRLISVRGAYRAHCTRAVKAANDYPCGITDHASLGTFDIIGSGTIVPFYLGKLKPKL